MQRGQHAHAAACRVQHGLRVHRAAQLVRDERLRRHGAQHPPKARLLGAPVQHVGIGPHIQLRHPAAHGGDFAALVHHAHARAPLGQAAAGIPQHGGLAHAGKAHNQQAAHTALLVPQMGHERIRRAAPLACHAKAQGTDIAQGAHALPLSHDPAAQAHAVPAAQGDKSLALLLGARIEGVFAQRLGHLLHLRLGGGTGAGDFPSRSEDAHLSPRAHADFPHAALLLLHQRPRHGPWHAAG